MSTTAGRRDKMISFRLSNEEYDTYREACAKVGIRSLSELARAGMQQFFSNHNGRDVDDKLRDLRHRIQFLSLELERITEEVKRRDGADRVPGNGYNLQEHV